MTLVQFMKLYMKEIICPSTHESWYLLIDSSLPFEFCRRFTKLIIINTLIQIATVKIHGSYSCKDGGYTSYQDERITFISEASAYDKKQKYWWSVSLIDQYILSTLGSWLDLFN